MKYVTNVQKSLGSQYAGWRFGTLICAVTTTLAFVINLTVTIWASAAHRSAENRQVIVEDDCGRIKNLNSGLHVIISILNTVMLSGSNYCMQCLSAPTREEIDEAHAKQNWLDIGVRSLRNLNYIRWSRILLWDLLALTSLPVHLYYNSAVFASISSNDYYVYSVTDSFFQGPSCPNCTTNLTQYAERASTLESMWTKARNGQLDRLENAACIGEYAELIQSKRRNLFLVSDNDDFLPHTAEIGEVYGFIQFQASRAGSSREEAADLYSWMCSGVNHRASCVNDIGMVKNAPGEWRVSDWPVRYCLSEKAEPRCQLRYNQNIMALVTAANFIKAALMIYLTFWVRDEPLMSMGDAVASFLQVEDYTTKDMCLLSLGDVKEKDCEPGARIWGDTGPRWKDVTSRRRRIAVITSFLAALAITAFLLHWGLDIMPGGDSASLPALVRMGYGAVDPRTMIIATYFPTSVVGNSLLANFPQAILSVLYFSYNDLFTTMLLGREWDSYASKRKGLRVSRLATGEQRSTYFLELPYRYAVPLTLLNGLLHWLLSQSIFVVSIDFYYASGTPRAGASTLVDVGPKFDDGMSHILTCGFSPIAIISVLTIGLLMVVAIVGFGYVPFEGRVTLVGSCSMAISAACHPLREEVDGTEELAIHEQKLQWGVVSIGEDGVEHCSFSSCYVSPPEEGTRYA